MLMPGIIPSGPLKFRVSADGPSQRPPPRSLHSQRGHPADPTVTLPVNPLAHSATPVVTFFEGGSALSEFRARQLLPRLQAVDPRIEGLSARYVHLVVTETALDAAGQERFAALLGYGEPFVAPARSGP